MATQWWMLDKHVGAWDRSGIGLAADCSEDMVSWNTWNAQERPRIATAQLFDLRYLTLDTPRTACLKLLSPGEVGSPYNSTIRSRATEMEKKTHMNSKRFATSKAFLKNDALDSGVDNGDDANRNLRSRISWKEIWSQSSAFSQLAVAELRTWNVDRLRTILWRYARRAGRTISRTPAAIRDWKYLIKNLL